MDSQTALPESASSTHNVGEDADGRGRRRAPLRLLFWIAPVLAVALAARPGYDWWHEYRSRQFHEACQVATDAGSWEQLRAIASQWVQWDPRSSEGWVFLAEARIKLLEVEAGVEALGRVNDSYHGALQALAVRGDILISDLNRPYEAIATYERMLQINPLADLARQRIIYFTAATLQRAAMIGQIFRAMELGCEPPESYGYLLLAYEVTFSDGLSLTTNWRKNYPDDETLEVAQAIYLAKFSTDKTLAIFGTSTVASGDISHINACLSKFPTNLEVLAFHLEKAIHEGDEQRVLELLGQCPPEAENDPRFWRFRGWYLAAQDRHEEAAEALRTGLKLFPFDWKGRLLLAGVLRRMNLPDDADRESKIGILGKELHQKLFELPDAKSLTPELIPRIHTYFKLVASPLVLRSWERRLD